MALTEKAEAADIGIIHPCVRSGFCCKQGICPYGEWDEKAHQCKFLQEDDPELGTHFCGKYEEIKKIEKDHRNKMFGCGCSSPLFNNDRDKVIKKLWEKVM